MDNNPVMQRVMKLTEHWRDAVMARPEARVFCWMGSSSVEHRMIKGFAMYHTSEESKIPDLFFNFNQPFDHRSEQPYGKKMVSDMKGFIAAWNDDADLVAKTGVLDWENGPSGEIASDEAFFLGNIDRLANALGVTGKDDYFVSVLLPQTVSDHGRFAAWIMNLMETGIPDHVRIMLFDTYDLKAFEDAALKFPTSFQYLYPDLDMNGAMGQILENAKSKKSTQQEKDAISFQQALIKMNEAISYADEANVQLNRKDCIDLCRTHGWAHLEALTCFFVHAFFVSSNDMLSGHQQLDEAIALADKALRQALVPTAGICLQYRVAKGNLYFMHHQYAEAAVVYRDCLRLSREGVDKLVVLGIYQMLANSIRKSMGTEQAWPCFREGWSLVGDEESTVPNENLIIRFYAKDMMETASRKDVEAQRLFDEMERWWGRQWMETLRGNAYNPVHTY